MFVEPILADVSVTDDDVPISFVLPVTDIPDVVDTVSNVCVSVDPINDDEPLSIVVAAIDSALVLAEEKAVTDELLASELRRVVSLVNVLDPSISVTSYVTVPELLAVVS